MKIREHVFFEKYAYKVSLLVTFALFGVIILLSFVTFLSVRKSMLTPNTNTTEHLISGKI